MTLDNNLKLAENAVLSVEDSLSKVFQERSNFHGRGPNAFLAELRNLASEK